MKSFRNEVRIDVLMAQGTVNVAFLKNERQAKALDRWITRMAGDALKGSLKTTYFFAACCVPTWEEIQVLFLELGQEVDVDTVKRYANRARLTLKDAAKRKPPPPELAGILS